jgi:hypothetical protein
VKEIQLTQGNKALVDDEDYEYLSRFNWRNHNGYAARTTSRKSQKKTTMLMHQEIIKDVQEGMDVDHINGNKSDNRRSNLRIVTRLQNCHNAPKRTSNTSGYKGVGFDKRKNKWRARFRYKGSEMFLGYFENKHDAARMYNFWAKDLFGEYARLNVIKEEENE